MEIPISFYEPNMHPNDTRRYWELRSSLGVNIGYTGNSHFFCKDWGIDILDFEWDSISPIIDKMVSDKRKTITLYARYENSMYGIVDVEGKCIMNPVYQKLDFAR